MTDSRAEGTESYSVALSGQARRNIHENLPLDVAVAAMETIEGSIAVNPYRAGQPLDEPFDGFYSARRGTYRISAASMRPSAMSRSTPSATAGTHTGPEP